MTPKEMKYNLHYGDVLDVLPPPHGTNTSCSETKNTLRIENGSLGFIETLHKQQWSLQHCLRPLAYTWAELHFQMYHNEPSDPKGNEI